MPVDPDWTDLEFAAQMTGRQFRAIELRICTRELFAQLPVCRKFKRAKKSVACDLGEVRRWLLNAWNTELLMQLSGPVVEDAGGPTLQWLFPQAYYAAYASALAFFQVAGYTEVAHTAVQRRFAGLAFNGQYPPIISFTLDGPPKSLTCDQLDPADESRPIYFHPGDSGSIDRKLYQFLKTTREIGLKKKADDLEFETAAGEPRKRFRDEDWKETSEALGKTGLLHLLYRKRIKANYREMDAFLDSGFPPKTLWQSLKNIVSAVGYVHECLICRAVGKGWYRATIDEHLAASEAGFLQRRRNRVLDICTT
jgi:hypothetical protein